MIETKINWTGFIFSLGVLKFLVLFVALKLCTVIDWPWIWVVSPVWISFGTVLIIACVAGILKGLLQNSKEKSGGNEDV